MQKFYTTIFLLFSACLSFAQTSDLLISEYGEGSSGNSKFIEIFNGTGSTVNLADYRIWTISNGGAWPEGTITLSGTLANNATYVIANNATDVPGANLYSGTCSWNGDDAVGLAKLVSSVWVLIDAVGTDGADPGTGWAVAGTANGTVDKRLTRKSTVCAPNTNWSASAGTTVSNSEWTLANYTTGSANAGHIVSCSASTSEIQLQHPAGTDVACGYAYDFGNVITGSTSDVTMRIRNTGTGNLNLGTISITGVNATEFSVIAAPSTSVAPAGFTDITIRFAPASSGTKAASLLIPSDDTDEDTCRVLLSGSSNFAACSELIISEYGEPATGNGKYLEIYNNTESPVNLAGYRLQKISNGGSAWPGTTLALSGTLNSGQTYLVANNSTDVPGAQLYNATFCNWNGNDAIGLAKNVAGTWYLTDAIGIESVDPGTGWAVAGVNNATADYTLVRKTSVNTPNADWGTSAGTNATNSEWIVRPYQLANTGCHINTCTAVSTVGFNVISGSVNESNTTVTVQVTMDMAPASTVTVNVTDAGMGTATSGLDYTVFLATVLTFTPSETYPNIKTVTLNILDDLISETNELITLDVDAQCGALIGNGRFTLTIIDNEIPEGIIVNEFGQGSNEKEYIELVVTGTPGTTVDLRGWVVDDNSGIFSGGYGSALGIAQGHLKFSDICSWEKVPVGAIILIYNASDKNASITAADDPTDANLDYLYVVGVETAPSSCATMSIGNDYFSSDCAKPNITSYDQYTPAVYTNADWATIQLRNGGDAVQVRSNSGGYFHGISYGSKGTSDCGTCDISLTNHPDYSTYGSDALYFSSTTLRTLEFENTVSNDYRNKQNWNTSTTTGAIETPGTFNSANNQSWILSLRDPFGVVLNNQSYTCNLRAYESRYYLDGTDSIIYWISNNTATNHGSFTAATILRDGATPGLGFQNNSLTGTPMFMQKTFTATPTVGTPAGYTIRFYVSNQELQDYCDYINPILNAIPGYDPNHLHTPATIISHLKIYRTSGTDRAWTVTSDTQVEIVTPVVSSYGGYTTFEHSGFSAFSGYALGDIVTPMIGLPVELMAFNARCETDNRVELSWSTASEFNSQTFLLERSENGIIFETIADIPASSNSSSVQHYQTTDITPYGRTYYRLQEIAQDGSRQQFHTILADCKELHTDIQATYQPGKGIEIVVSQPGESDYHIQLFQYDGKSLLQQQWSLSAGTHVLTLTNKLPLAQGIYLLRISNGTLSQTHKIWVRE
ncbi:MAG: hypothetical protein RL222_1560 [Bacteroidota bacterium]|jgi:hypothetical protein